MMKRNLISAAVIAMAATLPAWVPAQAQTQQQTPPAHPAAQPGATGQAASAPGAGTAAPDPKVVPKTKEGIAKQEPTADNLDANAQRAHDKQAPGSKSSKKSAQKPSRQDGGSRAGDTNTSSQAKVPAGDVRQWSQLDKNRDNLMQPEEIEAILKPDTMAAANTSPTPATGPTPSTTPQPSTTATPAPDATMPAPAGTTPPANSNQPK